MKRNQRSMDGFVARHPQRPLIRSQYEHTPTSTVGVVRTAPPVESPHGLSPRPVIAPANQSAQEGGTLKAHISESLREIDAITPETPRQKRQKHRKKRRIIKLASLCVGLILVLGIGWLVVKAWGTVGSVFQNGNLFDLFQQQPLKKDAHGRSNVLVLGTTDDDPNHPGATLTDSMMVISVHQDKKDAYMFSIPRDLYVQYGRACSSGYAGKINVYFQCAAQGDSREAEQQRMDATRQFIGKLFGLDIQYVVHVNTAVIRDAVNAVGGITVNVQSDDPRGVLDASVDWMCRAKELTAQQRRQRCPTGHYIHFKNGPNEMDGDKAIWFSRARGAFGNSYGLGGSNFDRERNQQLVLVALKEKATSTGTLTDIGKITKLMDAMGSNLRTNIDAKEIRTVMNLASDIKEANIHRLDFNKKDQPLMTTGSIPGAGSIVRPVAGLTDYTEVRAHIKRMLYATPISKEEARIAVVNAGAEAGAAQKAAEQLRELGMNVVHVGNAPANQSGQAVYQLGGGDKPATKKKLEERHGGSVKAGQPSFKLQVEVDFVVVLGR